LKSHFKILFWLLALSFLSVGLKNFEIGLNNDGPLYSAISRNIITSGDWFSLDGWVPEFRNYAEHPHLGFWFIAAVFKILPITDSSARIPGHLFFVFFLLFYYGLIKRLSSEKSAVWAILILIVWRSFSNCFSSVFLDPGLLALVTAGLFIFDKALVENRKVWHLLSGICLGTALLIKGLAIAQYLPVFLSFYLLRRRQTKLYYLIFFVLGFLSVVIPYISLTVLNCKFPFFQTYWQRQVAQRVAKTYSFKELLNLNLWSLLLKETYFLALLVPFSLFQRNKSWGYWISFLLAISFFLFYSPNFAYGAQYWLHLFPWLAWMIAESYLSKLPIKSESLIRTTTIFSIFAVWFVQYSSISIHHTTGTEELRIKEIAEQQNIKGLLIDMPKKDFIPVSRYVWYVNLPAYYSSDSVSPEIIKTAGYLLFRSHSNFQERQHELINSGWCLRAEFPSTQLLTKCKF